MIRTVLEVAFGGAIGATGRFLTQQAFHRIFGDGFPYGTLFVNVVGSLLMGVVFAALMRQGLSSRGAPFLAMGVLGGFTTFSAFSLDVWKLIAGGRLYDAMFYMLLSAGLSLGGLVLGILIARGIVG